MQAELEFQTMSSAYSERDVDQHWCDSFVHHKYLDYRTFFADERLRRQRRAGSYVHSHSCVYFKGRWQLQRHIDVDRQQLRQSTASEIVGRCSAGRAREL